MEILDLKIQIENLAIEHDQLNDWEDLSQAEFLEEAAEDLIIAYCRNNNYLINGFPDEKLKVIPEEEFDDYFCRERYRLYLDLLTIQKNDVAELMFYYYSLLYVNSWEIISDFIQFTEEEIKMYDMEI